MDNFEVIPFEELGRIEPDTMGYIDRDGNFYSLGKAKRAIISHFDESSFEGMGIKAHNLLCSLLNEKAKEELLKDCDFGKYGVNSHLPSWWPANKILEDLGFCRFFRGYYDCEESYVDLSYYKNATIRQLFVMNYLFALNYSFATNIEEKRQEIMRLYMEKLNVNKERNMKRTLKQ